MTTHRLSLFRLALICLWLYSAGSLAEQRFYRYLNQEGNVVIDHRIPNDYAGHAYEVINAKGLVLEVIPRQLSAAERAARTAKMSEEEQLRAAQQRARERDANLLLRYSSVEDIEAAKARAMSDLHIRISILKSNLGSLKQKIESSQSQAADLERQGQKVDVALLKVIKDLQQELRSTEFNIDYRQQELAEVASDYDEDIMRFEELVGLVNLRRRKERAELIER